MFKTIHGLFYALAWWMAVIGGVVLGALVLMICVSILGREASDLLHSAWIQSNAPGMAQWLLDHGIGPVFGDYEFLTAGMAISVYCFLGWCQITAGHATVDVFTAGLSDRTRRWLQVAIEALFAAVLILVAVQLVQGMLTQRQRGSTTFLLQYPVWWNYALAVVPAVASALIAVYMAIVRLAEALGNTTLIVTAGADH